MGGVSSGFRNIDRDNGLEVMRSTAGLSPGMGGVEVDRQEIIWRNRAVPRDVRLRREITHRQLFVARLRRVLRFLSLHVIDGAIVATVALIAAAFVIPPPDPGAFVALAVAIHLLSLNAVASYKAGDERRDFLKLGMGVVLANTTLATLALLPAGTGIDPLLFVAVAATTWSALGTGRALVDGIAAWARGRGIGLRRALLVGSPDSAERVIAELRDGRNAGHHIVGHVSPEQGGDPAAIGTIDRLAEVIETEGIREVIVSSTLAATAMSDVVASCFESGTALFVVASPSVEGEYRAEPRRVGQCALLRLHPARLEVPGLLVKRVFDVCASAGVLLLCAPLMAAIAIAIRLDSKGPVFYRAPRVGLGGQLFSMWKFRSMTRDAEKRESELAHLNIYANGTFKIANDPRVTRVGGWLRRTSLDELPQLFNVLIGEMSLVGPRPALPGDLDRYQPHHFERLTVIPGITGPWQVGGRNLVTDFETVIGMERQYIRCWSFWLDMKILARTPGVVWRGEGAY